VLKRARSIHYIVIASACYCWEPLGHFLRANPSRGGARALRGEGQGTQRGGAGPGNRGGGGVWLISSYTQPKSAAVLTWFITHLCVFPREARVDLIKSMFDLIKPYRAARQGEGAWPGRADLSPNTETILKDCLAYICRHRHLFVQISLPKNVWIEVCKKCLPQN